MKNFSNVNQNEIFYNSKQAASIKNLEQLISGNVIKYLRYIHISGYLVI